MSTAPACCANPNCPKAGIPLAEIFAHCKPGYAKERRYCSRECQRVMPRPGGRRPRLTKEERLFSKVRKDGPIPPHCPELGPCWEWIGARDNYGYGFLYKGPGRFQKAHRLSWEIATGKSPDNIEAILHLCDWPPCVNPAHLRAGTRKENNQDRAAKGRSRHPAGTECTSSNLTMEQVREIREHWRAGVSQTSLAKDYPVGQAQISRIVRNVVYRDSDYIPPSSRETLTSAQVAAIRKKWRAGFPQSRLAREYGISQTYVSMIVRGLAKEG